MWSDLKKNIDVIEYILGIIISADSYDKKGYKV